MRIREREQMALAFLLGRLKSHLRVTADDLDGELMAKLTAAADSAEHFIGKVILKSDFTDTFPFSPSIALCRPLISVGGVKVDGVDLPAGGYDVDLFAGVVTIPGDVTGRAVTVDYSAGMETVPSDIANAILLMASSMFANPMDSVETLPKASSALLRPHRDFIGMPNA